MDSKAADSYEGVKKIVAAVSPNRPAFLDTPLGTAAIDAFSKIASWVSVAQDFLQSSGTELDKTNPELVSSLGSNIDNLVPKRTALSAAGSYSVFWDGVYGYGVAVKKTAVAAYNFLKSKLPDLPSKDDLSGILWGIGALLVVSEIVRSSHGKEA